MNLALTTDTTLHSMVPSALLRDEDRATLAANREYLLGLTESIVSTFYDSAFGHAPTAAVFEEGERPAREETLRHWWHRTVGAPLDEQYFKWMSFVGIVHIRRGVSNPMMLSMLQVVGDFVVERATTDLGGEQAAKLGSTFGRLATTVGSLIAETFTRGYVGALEDLAGLDPKLTARMLSLEVKRLEEDGRAQIGG